jgi:hypothetical protein
MQIVAEAEQEEKTTAREILELCETTGIGC